MTVPLVGIVVLNWKRPVESVRCIESVLSSDYGRFRVYFVDNGSDDGSEERVRGLFSGVEVIQTGANLGYAGGNNAGIRQTLADGCAFVFVLNNDATIDRMCIARLVKAAAIHPEAGLLQPLIFKWGSDESYRAPVRWAPQFHGFRLVDAEEEEGDVIRVAYAAGTAMLVRREVFESVGLLDESFFLCWEEIDLSYRARRAGYGSLLVRSARAAHEGSLSFGGHASPLRDYFNCRNRWRWASRHLPRRHRLKLARDEVRAFAACLGDLVLGTGRGRRNALARLAAYRDLLLRRSGNAPAWVWRL